MPAGGVIADALTDPAVPHRVILHAAPADLRPELLHNGTRIRRGIRLVGRQEFVVDVGVPFLKKHVRLAELDKIQVVPQFRRPVDHRVYIFPADCALDAEPAVAVIRTACQMRGHLFHGEPGEDFPVGTWPDEPAAHRRQKSINPEQHAAGVASGDESLPLRDFDCVSIIKGGILHGRTGGGICPQRDLCMVAFAADPAPVAVQLFRRESDRIRNIGLPGQHASPPSSDDRIEDV